MSPIPEAYERKGHHHYTVHRQINRKFYLIQIETTYKELGISSKPKQQEEVEEEVIEDIS